LFLSTRERRVAGILFVPELETLEEGFGICFARVKRPKEIQRFADRNFVGEIRCLETSADAILELLLLPIGIEVEYSDFSGGARSQTFQNFDRACFAGSVWSKQPEDFAGPHLEIDAFDRFEASVRLPKATHVDGKFVAQEKTFRSRRDE
jgi:hypothetical protein